MPNQRFFFATRGDLVPGLEAIESQRELEYHLYEMRSDPAFTFLKSLLEAETLGFSQTGDAVRDCDYFVYPRDRRPPSRSIPQRKGGVRYVLNVSSEMVHFRPGGLHLDSGALVAGRVARAVHANERGRALYESFSEAALRGFRKVNLFWVGPEAYREFKSGRRLVTIGIRSPREYDLAEPGRTRDKKTGGPGA